MKKYKKAIKTMLNDIVGDDLAQEIFNANFPEQTQEEIDRDRAIELLEKGSSGVELTKEEKKELSKITGLKF